MSAESELRAILMAHAPLASALPNGAASIAIDETPDENFQRPHICFAKQYDRPIFGLDNTLLARTQGLSIQVVGTDRANAIAVRELVEAALLAGGLPWLDGAGGYDPEVQLEAEILTVEWID